MRPDRLLPPSGGGSHGNGGGSSSPSLTADEVGIGLMAADETRQAQDSVLKYDVTSGAWQVARSMRTPMHSMAAVAYHS